MATPVPLKPQETRVVGGVANLVRENPTMLVKSGDGQLWVQGGLVFDDSGHALTAEEIPGWFWEEYKKTTQANKDLHGGLKEPFPDMPSALIRPGFPKSLDPAKIPNVEDTATVTDLNLLNQPQTVVDAETVKIINDQTTIPLDDNGVAVVRGAQGPDPTVSVEGPMKGVPEDVGDVSAKAASRAKPLDATNEEVEEPTSKSQLMALKKDDLLSMAKAEGLDASDSDTKEALADKILASRDHE